jgi:hypothetical protein
MIEAALATYQGACRGPSWEARMGEPEPQRRRQTKQKLRRPQGAGIWPEAVPRTGGQIRMMTFLNAPVSSE